MKRIPLLLLLLCLGVGRLMAQNTQQMLWGAWIHGQKLSTHWGYNFDAQFRSADDADYLRNILLRPSAAYYFDKTHVANVGYAYIGTYGRSASGDKTFRAESRTWEQFTYTHKLCASTPLSHRFRLEQRYLGDSADGANDSYFAQRLRYFVRSVIPFKKDSVFTNGLFLALQNEAFINIQNKQKVNSHFFDQNRAYIALGYRLNKEVAIEAGYMNQYVKGVSGGTTNNILQFVLYTKL